MQLPNFSVRPADLAFINYQTQKQGCVMGPIAEVNSAVTNGRAYHCGGLFKRRIPLAPSALSISKHRMMT